MLIRTRSPPAPHNPIPQTPAHTDTAQHGAGADVEDRESLADGAGAEPLPGTLPRLRITQSEGRWGGWEQGRRGDMR
eukprot:623963-Rhodomonas_salina.2